MGRHLSLGYGIFKRKAGKGVLAYKFKIIIAVNKF